ncbi:MAG TPA: LuxR C-terminal-related transcriptional regulator [Candidatus Eisenbacteria bacterium]
MRLARDLHDVTAHTIAVIAIQAGVADEALDGCAACPERARQAVRAIRVASREAMAELKGTVTMLREGAAPRGPLPGLGQLDELVGMATSAGVRVQLTVAGAARPLPHAIDLTAYRIVQESLTNVLRHAQATSATIRLRYRPEAVEIEVDDDGPGAGRPRASVAGTRSQGHGLAVMAERAARPAREPAAASRVTVLTDREREVLALVGEGLANDDIAVRLFMGPATVKTHVSRTMGKLAAHDRAQLVVLAYETGLVRPGWL